jgi:hypothetical protein
MVSDDSKPGDLTAAIQSVAPVDTRLQVVVRLQNKAARALHYVADVRAMRYDPTTRTLTLALSDEGREVIPSLAGKLPLFRHVDPGSEAEIHLSVPDKIVKLSRSAGSAGSAGAAGAAESGELAFETQQLADVREVVVEVAWADVPYYHDTRASALQDARLPAARWEQHKARATKRQDKKRMPKP